MIVQVRIVGFRMQSKKEEKENLALGGKGDLAAFDLHGNVKSCKWGGAIFTAYVTKGMLEKK